MKGTLLMKIVYDTNALLKSSHTLSDENENIIPEIVIDELDHIKSQYKGELSVRARRAVRKIRSLTNKFIDKEFGRNHPLLDSSRYGKNDDLIVECARVHNALLITGDYLAELKAESQGVNSQESDIDNQDEVYCGFKEIILNESELARFYENGSENTYELLVNQYLIIRNKEGKEVDCVKWNGKHHTECVERNLSTVALGKFKPKDVYQVAAIDSLLTNPVTLLKGKAGSGKSLIALTYALNLLEKGRINKVICVVNPVPVRGAQEIGFYKGDKNEKLLQSGIGNILISKLGDRSKVEAMLTAGELVLIPMVDLRGYDTGDKSLIWITEAQNTSSDLMKLSLQRVAEGSQIIIDGDDKTQVDDDMFAGTGNGIKSLSRVFKGESVYGEVEFNTIYRSKIAQIADRM